MQNEPSDCAKGMERGELFISTIVPRGSRIGFHVYNLTGYGAFHMTDFEKGASEGVAVWEWPSRPCGSGLPFANIGDIL